MINTQEIKTRTSSSTSNSVNRKSHRLTPNVYSSISLLPCRFNISQNDLESIISVLLNSITGIPSIVNDNEEIKPIIVITELPTDLTSSSCSRSHAASNLSIIVQQFGVLRILKRCNVLDFIQSILCNSVGIGLSLVNNRCSSKKNEINLKYYPNTPQSREGCLFLVRSLCELHDPTVEPFVIPLLSATLYECSSSVSPKEVRIAAEDASIAIISIAQYHSIEGFIFPVLFLAMDSMEWNVVYQALKCWIQLANRNAEIKVNEGTNKMVTSQKISLVLPRFIPKVTSLVWHTKSEVSNSASTALLLCCKTNPNPDISPVIESLVDAIVKPQHKTFHAIEQLKATTFIVSVEASTLAIITPILMRELKEGTNSSIHACCLIIDNMSKLIEITEDLQTFVFLLAPELQRVMYNVSFKETRDLAVATLNSLNHSLDQNDFSLSNILNNKNLNNISHIDLNEAKQVFKNLNKESESNKEELEDKKIWKEVAEAQRLLNKIKLEESKKRNKENAKKRQLTQKSLKGTAGKCKGCGLKRCKKSCLFRDMFS